jgi:RNA polymerase sigma factor (sigma-70 family)
VVDDPRDVGLEAIEAVYRLRLSELRRVATAITGNREAGLDAVQEAFAIAVRRRDQFRGEGSLDAWLWRIVVNSALDHVSAVARTIDVVDEAVLVETNGAHRSSGDHGDLWGLVSRLPERQRLVLFLRYYAELDYGTIADTVGISPGTVGATLNQARASLRRLIEEVPA